MLSGRLSFEASPSPGLPNLRVPFQLATQLTQAKRGSLLVRADNGFVIQSSRRIPRAIAREILPEGSGIVGWVAYHKRPLLIKHRDQLPSDLRLRRHGYRTDSFISVPIRLHRTVVGVINVADQADGRAFTDHELDLLLLIARQAADVIRLNESVSEAVRLAGRDPLTGLANRRNLDRRLEEEVERAKRYGLSLSALLIDVDDFKAINDQ